MPELLFHKYAPAVMEPTLSKVELFARFAKFDLIDWKPDGWGWGEQELHNARFRLIKWPALPVGICQQLMGASVPTLDSVTHIQQTYPMLRLPSFNFQDPTFTTALPAFTVWWNDDTRTTPFFTVNNSTVTNNVANFIANKATTAYP